jgi:hypothetical protein
LPSETARPGAAVPKTLFEIALSGTVNKALKNGKFCRFKRTLLVREMSKLALRSSKLAIPT